MRRFRNGDGILSGTAVQASNLYDIGPLLNRVTRTCLDAGATPIYLHHTRKGLAAGQPAELDDLAFAGVAEYARQWLLVNRRTKYDPETGTHELWLSVGGSCGQSGMWAVDVAEGRLDENFEGRTWDVTVTTAGEHRDTERAQREAARQTKRQEQVEADAALVLTTLERLDPDNQGHGYNRVRNSAGLSTERMARAVARLVEQGTVVEVQVSAQIGSKATRQVKGIRRRPAGE
jgi:replicative DNA helicase